MIKAEELRIGNYIKCANTLFRVTDINKTMCSAEPITEGDILFGRDKFKPVPINPAILQIAGFKKTTKQHSLHPNKAVFENENLICVIQSKVWLKEESAPENPYLYFFYITGLEGSVCFRKEFLHELQNLFFALASKELEFHTEMIATV